jgi:hypothetical protein
LKCNRRLLARSRFLRRKLLRPLPLVRSCLICDRRGFARNQHLWDGVAIIANRHPLSLGRTGTFLAPSQRLDGVG